MLSEPLAALDLPLRVASLGARAACPISYPEPSFVAQLFGIPAEIPAHAEALVHSVCGWRRPTPRAERPTGRRRSAGKDPVVCRRWGKRIKERYSSSASVASGKRKVGLVPAGTWQIDPSHSSVEFQVKRMMIATVKGRFT